MNDALSELLHKAVSGNQQSVVEILRWFKEQKIASLEQEQIHIYLKQAVRTSHDAIYLRALLFDQGYGVTLNVDMAFILMREAAAKGNALATYEIGHRYLEGRGVEQHYENALQWLKLAASSPHYVAAAMHDLGLMYERGLGVEADSQLAASWYQKAAERSRAKQE